MLASRCTLYHSRLAVSALSAEPSKSVNSPHTAGTKLGRLSQSTQVAMSGQSGSGGDGWDDFLSGLKVMVVDDDPLCLKVVEHMLRRCSYTGSKHELVRCTGWFVAPVTSLHVIAVTTCPNGVTALERLRDKNQHYDLVLSDVYMPGTDAVLSPRPPTFAHPCLLLRSLTVSLQMLMVSSFSNRLAWS